MRGVKRAADSAAEELLLAVGASDPLLLRGFSFEEISPTARAVKPGILLLHTAVGVHNLFIQLMAERLESIGFKVLFADLYGKNEALEAWEDPAGLMQRNRKYRLFQAERTCAGLLALAQLKGVDRDRIGVLGYCYGGQCALDLVRRYGMGNELKCQVRGVVTMHGILDSCHMEKAYSAKLPSILCLHGANDPYISKESKKLFFEEMGRLGADLEFTSFSGACHDLTRWEKCHSPFIE